MATPTLVANKFVNTLADTPESMYTSPATGKGTIISAFTAANNSLSNKSYRAYIVSKGELPVNPQRPFKIVIWDDEPDLGSGIDNQVIPPGGKLFPVVMGVLIK